MDFSSTGEFVRSIREHSESVPSCPSCKGMDVERVVAPFFAQTSRKS